LTAQTLTKQGELGRIYI